LFDIDIESFHCYFVYILHRMTPQLGEVDYSQRIEQLSAEDLEQFKNELQKQFVNDNPANSFWYILTGSMNPISCRTILRCLYRGETHEDITDVIRTMKSKKHFEEIDLSGLVEKIRQYTRATSSRFFSQLDVRRMEGL